MWGQASGLVARLGMVDIPSRQSQEVLEHDFEKDGHIALFSSPGMGKSTFVQTLVMDLARQLTPEELHFYLLDFGTNGLLPLRDLPHTADLLMAEDTEKLTKFMRRIKEELAKRKAAFSRYAVPNLTLYRQASGDELPVIFLVLDNFDGLKEASLGAEMETLLQTLAREGASLGIYLVLTAGRSGALRPGLQASLKTRLALKLTDDVESRTIVGRHQHVMEEVPGRGLVHLDEVEVFQVALPAYAKDSFGLVQAVQDEAKTMAASWTGRRPEGIPVMPESLTFEEFAGLASVQEAVAGGELPIGLDFENVESVGLNIGAMKHLLVFGDQLSTVGRVMKHIVTYSLSLLSEKEIIYVSSEQSSFNFTSETIDRVITTEIGVEKLLFQEIQQRKTQSIRKVSFCIIPDIIAFLEQTKMSYTDFIKLYQESLKVGVQLIIGAQKSSLLKTDLSIKYIKENLVTAIVAQRLYDQSIVQHKMTSREETLKVDEVYLYHDQDYQKVKISKQVAE
ncbi:FtsK/SpoIIIE family protein [Streptococcus suis]|nr:FtsK/SpoIIIE family protein [Streptococcus suis]